MITRRSRLHHYYSLNKRHRVFQIPILALPKATMVPEMAESVTAVGMETTATTTVIETAIIMIHVIEELLVLASHNHFHNPRINSNSSKVHQEWLSRHKTSCSNPGRLEEVLLLQALVVDRELAVVEPEEDQVISEEMGVTAETVGREGGRQASL